VIRLEGVTKTFGPVRALAGVTLEFRSGRVSVICGSNGSGKSTLLAVLGTLAKQTSGLIDYGDLGRSRVEIRRTLGWAGHDSLCYPDLTGLENIELAARLHGCDLQRSIERVRERFDLGAFAKRPVRTYSRGQRQRVALARALVHRPRLVLLDEPTSGLDSAAVERLVGVLREEASTGVLVVLVTHDPPFASVLGADTEVTTLERGRVVTSP
jgi:heme exporter protein A